MIVRSLLMSGFIACFQHQIRKPQIIKSQYLGERLEIACPFLKANESYFDERRKRLGEMIKDAERSNNHPTELCRVLAEQISMYGRMVSIVQSCLPSNEVELRKFEAGLSSQLRIANQQRKELGCR